MIFNGNLVIKVKKKRILKFVLVVLMAIYCAFLADWPDGLECQFRGSDLFIAFFGWLSRLACVDWMLG